MFILLFKIVNLSLYVVNPLKYNKSIVFLLFGEKLLDEALLLDYTCHRQMQLNSNTLNLNIVV